MRVQLPQVRVRVLTVSVALALLAGLAACSDDPVSTPQPTYPATRRGASSSPSTPTAGESTSPSERVRNDLARLPLRRSVREGPLTVNIAYSTRLPIKDWQAGLPKPLRVTLNAVNRSDRSQNVYLQRATVEVTAYGESGFVERPEAVTDDAVTITPGFIVKPPNTYSYVFKLPAVNDSAELLTIDFTYELVTQVSPGRDPGDYAKQVATDTIVVPVPR